MSEYEIEGMPGALLCSPLDFLFADHFRLNVLCNLLDGLAFDPGSEEFAQRAMTARDYLAHELPLHIADEEEGLFAQLRRIAPAEDRIRAVIALLVEEHQEDMRLAADVFKELAPLAEMRLPASGFFTSVVAFTTTQRRHIVWENSVLLPEARRRLGAAELEALGRGMASRRGVDYPG